MNKILAFTLIELLVVIAVIGILSGLIVVSMSGTTEKATIAKAQVFSSSLRSALMSNLVAEYKFNGTGVLDGETVTTSYLQDSWGNNHETSITATPKVYSGSNCVDDSCLYFDVASSVSGATSLITSKEVYTIDTWVKIPTNSVSVWFIRMSPSGYPSVSPCFGSGFRPIIYLTGSSTNFKYVNADLRDDKWHNVVYVIVGSATTDVLNHKIYVDGISKSSGSYNNTVVANLPSGVFTIGSSSYVGYADTIRVYDAILPTSQIRQNYFIGLKSMLNNGAITKEEYLSRIGEYAIK